MSKGGEAKDPDNLAPARRSALADCGTRRLSAPGSPPEQRAEEIHQRSAAIRKARADKQAAARAHRALEERNCGAVHDTSSRNRGGLPAR
ncbi:hypothetical protein OHS70_38375 (plasmid) [Streptomyces sp. NBC_00390]|uniref:hypothetical protein n=1 Tax=Streptomyces sp. NBC_00390 TaxID=2975736 RepID=UPI002E1AE9F3